MTLKRRDIEFAAMLDDMSPATMALLCHFDDQQQARIDRQGCALNALSGRLDLVVQETADYGEVLYVLLDRYQAAQQRLDAQAAWLAQQDRQSALLRQQHEAQTGRIAELEKKLDETRRLIARLNLRHNV